MEPEMGLPVLELVITNYNRGVSKIVGGTRLLVAP